jgi:hypothetical protein
VLNTKEQMMTIQIQLPGVQMTYAQLQGLAAAMLAQRWAAFQNLKTRKNSVRAATTVADVQAVIW